MSRAFFFLFSNTSVCDASYGRHINQITTILLSFSQTDDFEFLKEIAVSLFIASATEKTLSPR